MVSKKTQTTEAKKAEVKDEAKAKVVTEKKKVATKTVAAKTVAKKPVAKEVVEPKAAKAKVAKKVVEVKVAENPVPEKENVDTLATVLAVKAENENKKAAKALKKEVKASAKKSTVKAEKVEVKTEAKKEVVEELGKKATPVRNKREAVKENAKKAQAKKFVEQKNEAVKCHCCCKCKEFFGAWARAYKNMFKYKARTSRYESWAFISTLTPAIIEGNLTAGKLFYAGFVLLFVIAQLFVYTALIARRLHDAGFTAWKGFFKPLTISSIAMVVLTGLSEKYLSIGGDLTAENYLSTHVTNLVLSVTTLVAIFSWVYYSLKTILVSFFYEEDKSNTTYGEVMYCDTCYKTKGIRYMVLYFIYSSVSYSLLNMYIMAIASMLKI